MKRFTIYYLEQAHGTNHLKAWDVMGYSKRDAKHNFYNMAGDNFIEVLVVEEVER